MDRAAYIAGILDADGHISWRGGRYSCPNVGVTSTSTALIDWLTEQVGGSRSLQRATCPSDCAVTTPNHFHRKSSIWKWHVTGERACILLRSVLPYLIIKADRAELVLRQYEEHLAKMQRPARRQHHIEKERQAMKARGWD